MKRIPTVLSAVSLCVLSVSSSRAAEPSSGPPKILQIFREEVKPGKGAAHEKVEVGWPALFAKVSYPAHYLAMTSISGGSEAWFITPWDSFAAAEKQQQADDANAVVTAEVQRLSALDGELLTRGSGMLATYREDLSYRPDFRVSTMRYFSVTTVHVNPGHEADFAAVRKLVNDAHDKAKIDEHWLTYQVVSGTHSGTYLIFVPLKSLGEMDTNGPLHGKPFQDALGEESLKKLRELSSAAIKGSDTATFAFSPKMSYVSKEFASGDPDFWTPKPKPAAAPPKKEPAKK